MAPHLFVEDAGTENLAFDGFIVADRVIALDRELQVLRGKFADRGQQAETAHNEIPLCADEADPGVKEFLLGIKDIENGA